MQTQTVKVKNAKKIKETKAKRRPKPPLEFKQSLKDYFKEQKKRLPTRLSDWILIAVDDAIRLSKMKNKYRLNMDVFNEIEDRVYDEEKDEYVKGKICEICLGGAAIVGRKLVDPGDGTNGDDTTVIACGLNSVRCGYLIDAVLQFYEVPDLNGISESIKSVLCEQSANLDKSQEENSKKGDSALNRPSWDVLRSAAKALAAVGL